MLVSKQRDFFSPRAQRPRCSTGATFGVIRISSGRCCTTVALVHGSAQRWGLQEIETLLAKERVKPTSTWSRTSCCDFQAAFLSRTLRDWTQSSLFLDNCRSVFSPVILPPSSLCFASDRDCCFTSPFVVRLCSGGSQAIFKK